jgi:hypothetical protein
VNGASHPDISVVILTLMGKYQAVPSAKRDMTCYIPVPFLSQTLVLWCTNNGKKFHMSMGKF